MSDTSLEGWRVLVPRGGPWGDQVAANLRSQGAIPVVAPLINFASSNDPARLEQALAELADGRYDWLTVTSATTVDVLSSYRATIPETTKVAAVGETAAAALQAAGYAVDLVPDDDNSSAGMAKQLIALEPEPKRVLSLRSEIAKPVLSSALTGAGHHVNSVVAYRTIGVPAPERAARDVLNGRINAILVTSGSIAQQVAEQFPTIPGQSVIVAIGPRTARDADAAGLPIHAVAAEQSVVALIDTLHYLPVPPPTPEALAIPTTGPVPTGVVGVVAHKEPPEG